MCVRRLVLFAFLSVAPVCQDQAPAPLQPASLLAYFPTGERLVFNVKWDPPWFLRFFPSMEAGEIDLRLAGEAEYEGKRALKITFQAHSSGTLARITGMKVDDEFVFYTDPKTLCTMAVSSKIQEGRRRRQIDVDYLPETRQLHIREMDESFAPAKLRRDEIKGNIPVCVQDPLSALYFYRKSQLELLHVQNFVIGHDDRIKEVRARVEKREMIETPAGNFASWKISTMALMEGLFREGGQFRIWLSADERKVPVQFEVRVRLGKVLGKLKLCSP